MNRLKVKKIRLRDVVKFLEKNLTRENEKEKTRKFTALYYHSSAVYLVEAIPTFILLYIWI